MNICKPIILALITLFCMTNDSVKRNKTMTYYFDSVNGNDFNEGDTSDSPYKSLKLMNGIILKPGDTVYIKSGSVYRGSLNCKKGVTYKSYGKGEKPTFLGSVDASDASAWKKTKYENVWVYSKVQTRDIGNIIFDNGKANGIKKVNGKLGFEGSVKELKSDLEFWHNTLNRKVYLYSEQNPAERFKSIEMAKCKHVINLANGVTLDGIRVLYGGAHGITGSDLRNITIRRCDVGWTGGSLQPDLVGVRYGNAIEFWAEATDILVENCNIYQIYDAGLTFQSNDSENYRNIKFIRNHVSYCTYSVEYFNADGKGSINDVLIDSNSFEYAGMGWGSQRPDPGHTAHINSWNDRNNNCNNYVISNNVFNLSTRSLFVIESTSGCLPTMKKNKYIQTSDGDLTIGVKYTSREASRILYERDPSSIRKVK